MKKDAEIDIKDFHCIQCQACCRQSGYVRLQPEEPDAIADALGMDVYTFIEKYTRLTRDRQCLALIDQPNGACIFLNKTGCQIQHVKPNQCKTFPHKWKYTEFATICGWAKKQKGNL
ncbi:MAG: Fe-S oxidoreductase [Desulfobacterales bacterium]|nr:MAG: Fe-S oxidoreductase [Desulfobacterales bacterium]